MQRAFLSKSGRILFVPPPAWIDDDRFEAAILAQGLKTIPLNATEQQREEVRKDPLFSLNFLLMLQSQ